MPHIIVTADRADDHGEGAVMLMERINLSDLDSQHFAGQLVERLGWAVSDAHDAELSAQHSHTAPHSDAAQHRADQREDARDSASVVITAS